MKKILFISPHTDDVELGCGGTISRFLEEGKEVFTAAFSTAEESLPEGVEPGTLKNEFINSMNIFNIPDEKCFIFKFPVRRLSYYRQEVLDELIELKKRIQPDTVFIPSGNDLHQDHNVLYNEALRAFKDITIFGYELPWNHITFSAQAFIVLEDSHLEMKWRALFEYKTQIDLKRNYFSKEFIESLARIRGNQVKARWAEAFEVLRLKI